jgi:hypothetical protein
MPPISVSPTFINSETVLKLEVGDIGGSEFVFTRSKGTVLTLNHGTE